MPGYHDTDIVRPSLQALFWKPGNLNGVTWCGEGGVVGPHAGRSCSVTNACLMASLASRNPHGNRYLASTEILAMQSWDHRSLLCAAEDSIRIGETPGTNISMRRKTDKAQGLERLEIASPVRRIRSRAQTLPGRVAEVNRDRIASDPSEGYHDLFAAARCQRYQFHRGLTATRRLPLRYHTFLRQIPVWLRISPSIPLDLLRVLPRKPPFQARASSVGADFLPAGFQTDKDPAPVPQSPSFTRLICPQHDILFS